MAAVPGAEAAAGNMQINVTGPSNEAVPAVIVRRVSPRVASRDSLVGAAPQAPSAAH
jgi:hypothetical protein